jgi:phosphatidylinositol-3-phosphatase
MLREVLPKLLRPRAGAHEQAKRRDLSAGPAGTLRAKITALLGGDWASAFDPGAIQMPAPWAAAAAVLALLAFGVLLGSTVSAGGQDGPATQVLLEGAPRAAATQPSASPRQPALQPPPVGAEAQTPSTSEESSSGEGAAEKETQKAAKQPHAKTKAKHTPPAQASPTVASSPLPPIKHVFLIVLSEGSLGQALAAGSQAPYLAGTLRKQGELLQSYYAVSTGELANEIALLSGQGPTAQTAANCPTYADLAPATKAPDGQVLGSGCVYPSTTLTIADELTAQGQTWRAYIEGLGGPGQPVSCEHPAIGAQDSSQASPADPYLTWRNPFVYFHSLTDTAACAKNDVGLGSLASDLKSASDTPALAYIAPGPCDDGSPQPCAPGQPAGLAPADVFLRNVVTQIEGSPAYKQGGLIAITFDQAPQSGPQADSRGCCINSPYPNLPAAPAGAAAQQSVGSSGTTGSSGAQGTAPSGGGEVGLLLISRYVKPGSESLSDEYDHFSLLGSIAALFGLQPLGYATTPGLLTFDKSVYNAYK